MRSQVKNCKNVKDSNVYATSAHETRTTATIQLPISNDHGIPVLQDFLAEVQRQYDVEKNIKNNLYAFILQEGLFEKLKRYEKLYDTSLPGGHARAVAVLSIPGTQSTNNKKIQSTQF